MRNLFQLGCLLLGCQCLWAATSLMIDFSQDGGPVAAGYQAYTAQHEVPNSFTPQSFAAFGSIITLTPSWPKQASAQAMQMVQRSAASDLLIDWIGADTRVGDADPMVLMIEGLPAGTYAWTSAHHDPHDQTGLFDLTVIDDKSIHTVTGIDISDGPVSPAEVTYLETTLVSSGVAPIVLIFDLHDSQVVSRAFFVMNSLVLEALNPCANEAPVIKGPGIRSALSQEPVTLHVTVTDDGFPYREGCFPNRPDVGIPHGLSFQWQQMRGPVTLSLDTADWQVEDLIVTFPETGLYAFRLTVTDGPLGEEREAGKESTYDVAVQVHDVASISELRINEFLASNREGLRDGYGNSSDWIELLNDSPNPVSLDGWCLTDDADNLAKWCFPAGILLASGEYLVVFASAATPETMVDTQGFLHTHFKLSKNGEYLGLVRPDGTVAQAFAPTYPEQRTDISYGGPPFQETYFAKPTPGQANEQAFPGFVTPVVHSHARGFYEGSFDLQLFCDSDWAEIRYTLDGSEPTTEHGFLYSPGTVIPVSTTMQVRSFAYQPGWRSAPVTTHTYLFVEDVALQPAEPLDWPTDWGYSSDAKAVVPADYEMDPRVVNHTLPGYSVPEALLAIPSLCISMKPDDFISDATGIYANPQSRWERKCSVEYILPPDYPDPRNSLGFQHDCKIEVHGNASRRPYRMQKHSLRLTFTSEYGPAQLEYPLFADTDVESFNQLVLRACFTDSWGLVSWGPTRYRPNDSQYLRDVWMKDSLGAMGQPTSHGNFVHLYVNGLYFGLFNLTERIREEFFASYLGGEPEDWEVNVDLSHPGPRWRAMMGLHPATAEGYLQMQTYLDMENFADYMLLHFFADAEDWPHHNGYAAANAVSDDGRFRFWVWDQEIVLDYHGRAASRINSNRGAGALLQKLRVNADFRMLFADRVYKHCFHGGALTLAAAQARYRARATEIDRAIVAESARWGDTQHSTPYGNPIQQPNPLTDVDHLHYPPAPHGPDHYFTREDSWIVERDNILNNYLPAIYDTNNHYALMNVLRAANLYPDIDPPLFIIDNQLQHGGDVPAWARLSLINPNNTGNTGTIYYTLDGNDPRLLGSEALANTFTIVAEAADKILTIPRETLGDTWKTEIQEVGRHWMQGTGSVGYERGQGYSGWIETDVGSAMYQQHTSCYVQIPFTLTGVPGDLAVLSLNVRYDDGFVAYLNGVEVARAQFTGEPQWNSAASGSHESSGFEAFDISSFRDRLRAGENLLAIQGMNTSTSSSDFLLGVELAAGQAQPDAFVVSPSAQSYTDPLPVSGEIHIKARCLHGRNWSALAETQFYTP